MKYLLGLATSATLIFSGINSLFANDLMDGLHPFLCNDQSFVIIEDNDTWSIANSTVDVSATENGWRIDNKEKPSVGYLRKTRGGTWFLDWLDSDGHEQWNCTDLFSATDQVVEIIKPKIDQNIVTIQGNLKSVEDRLATALDDLAEVAASAEAQVNEVKAKAEAQVNEFKVKEGELKYLRPALKRERSELRAANKIIAAQEAEITSLLSKLESQRQSVENLRYALDQKESDVRAANEKYNSLLKDPSGRSFLQELKVMGPTERNKAMLESKFGGPALVRTGQLENCIRSLRDKALLSDDCEIILVDFLLDPDAK